MSFLDYRNCSFLEFRLNLSEMSQFANMIISNAIEKLILVFCEGNALPYSRRVWQGESLVNLVNLP